MLTALTDRFPLLKGLLDFVYPPLCSGCGTYTDEKSGICAQCLGRIEWYGEPGVLSDLDFRGSPQGDSRRDESFPLFAAGCYSEPLRDIVLRFKFHGVVGVAALMAGEIAERFARRIEKLAPAVLVPVPLHPSREYVRGYNQAALFANALSRRLDIPVVETLLCRTRNRRPQAKLKPARRVANIRGVFEFSSPGSPPDGCERVILVDDVVTSGQTLFEARRVLRRGGVRVVGAVAIAHGHQGGN